ncbi:Gldg family protein [Bowmanella sp. JS7-9]|uniref:GldG family protein n=1 Tax=Pseudobowmanella zhangzhouensis TaxID=1537679 RepID=A0ABW1XKJ7_9ALTE|nr:Gldg family protein [Bowmanella sp. JS7-9]TBX22616.1 ABC transporter [Bowmanella sp. JS7-9]
MLTILSRSLTFVLLALAFAVLVLLNNTFLKDTRLDLTEQQIYSLSAGSKAIVADIDEPVNLYFFYSDKASTGMTQLRNYANRVYSLLEEYASTADGKIILHKVDPEPFSEAEDQADEFGLTAASIGAAGDAIYLGLAGRNAYDEQAVVAFFDLQQERFLEYEISKLLHKLSDPKPVHVTVITDLPVNGGQNPMSGRFDPAWVLFTQLEQLYEVETLGNDAQSIPEETDVLMLVAPKGYSEALLVAIDQYVLAGGKAMLFLDPVAESDPMAMFAPPAAENPLASLLAAWGVSFDPNAVLLDAQNGLEIRTQNGVERHLGYVGLTGDSLDVDDITTAGLQVINGASFGVLNKQQGAESSFTPLLQSSVHAATIDAPRYGQLRDVAELARAFDDQQQRYTLAARIHGKANSAFTSIPEGVEWQSPWLSKGAAINLIVVADTDLLTDRFWGSQANFFGQNVFTPFANNGDFVTNAVENLGGSNALISVRGRGTYARPFEVVQALTVKAEQSFRAQEQRLQDELAQTEQQLAGLQAQQAEGGALILSPEQQAAVDQFLDKKIEIRKELREVRHQLDKDIEILGMWLKVLNIAVAPVLLVSILWLLSRMMRRRAGRKAK